MVFFTDEDMDTMANMITSDPLPTIVQLITSRMKDSEQYFPSITNDLCDCNETTVRFIFCPSIDICSTRDIFGTEHILIEQWDISKVYDSDSKIHESSKWSNHVLDTLFAKSSIGEYFRKKTKVLYGSSLEPIEEPKKYSNDSIIVHDSNWYNTYEIKVSYTDFPLSKIYEKGTMIIDVRDSNISVLCDHSEKDCMSPVPIPKYNIRRKERNHIRHDIEIDDIEIEEEEEEEKESKFTTKTSNPIPIPIGSVPRIGMVSPRLNTKKLRNRSKSTNLCPNTRRISPILSPRGIPSSFVGSLQESLLSGNLQGTKSSILNGFSATVCATSPHLGGSPARLKIPFDTMHYHLEDFNKTPYAGSIYLPKERYRIAKNGTLQVAILNPSGTLVKLFLVRYDLSSMKPNSKTFIRQITRNSDPPHVLQYAVQFTIICTKRGRLYLYKNIRVVFPHRKPDDLDKLEVICQSPDTPQYFQG